MKSATELSTASAGEVLAWLHESDPARCITDLQKASALRDGGASASSVMPYSVPLYASPAPGRAPLTDEQAADLMRSLVTAGRNSMSLAKAANDFLSIAPAGGIGGE